MTYYEKLIQSMVLAEVCNYMKVSFLVFLHAQAGLAQFHAS